MKPESQFGKAARELRRQENRACIVETCIKPGLKHGLYCHILPRHHVYLLAIGKGGEKFARLFTETWKRLPLSARRCILGHWRNDTPNYRAFSPTIELLDHWSRRETGRGLLGDMGCTYDRGHHLCFWTKIVKALPDNLVCDLIAHELAHVYQWGRGWDLNEDDSFLIEDDADGLIEEWGFSSTGIPKWFEATGKSKVINLDELGPRQRRRVLASAKRAGRF